MCVRLYLDEAGSWVPPLLEVLLSMLLLHLQGKAWPQNTLQAKTLSFKIPAKTWALASRHCEDTEAIWEVFDLQLAGRRRRSPAEQNRLIITVQSTSAGSCHRSRWSWGWSEVSDINNQESELCLTSWPSLTHPLITLTDQITVALREQQQLLY